MAQDIHPWEKKGKALQSWIEGSGESKCPYSKSTLSLTCQHIQQDFRIKKQPALLKTVLRDTLGISHADTTFQQIEVTQRGEGAPIWWTGRVGRGMIIIDDMFRSSRSSDPFISEFTQAAYQLAFPLSSLKSIVAAEINQKDTLRAVKQVYKSEKLSYPSSTQYTWHPSSPEYRILLGSGIGRVVAALVLGAWGQHTKKIFRIVTFFLDSDIQKLCVSFEVDDI
jgi:hypothetical protein